MITHYSSTDLDDHFHDECGLCGVWNQSEASNYVYLGLHALQHRGQESAGIVSWGRGEQHGGAGSLFHHRAMGHVNEIFTQPVLEELPGSGAIGHVRYSTAGESHLKNAQPFVVDYHSGQLAVAHNGNLVNAKTVRKELELKGSLFRSTSDTEVILHLVSRSREKTTEDRIIDAMSRLEGAYSLLFLEPGRMIALRDPHGVRPLCFGKVGESWVVASESTSLSLLGGTLIRDVEPGEMLIFDTDHSEPRSLQVFPKQGNGHCIFEHVYFAKPDSVIDGHTVYESRRRMGMQLARESGVPADVVIPVPDSGVPASIGFAEEAGLMFQMGMVRSHYIGRTFIEPSQRVRNFGVKLKLLPVKDVIQGKRVVVIDDSIVRGTTSKKIVDMVWAAGATEVHMRISSPPTVSPCYYGIDTPRQQELLANRFSIDEIREYIGATSLAYLSLEGMIQSIGIDGKEFCHACFSGNYPIDVTDLEYSDDPQLSIFSALNNTK